MTQKNKKKYEKGGKIKTLTEACIRIQERKPFYWRHKFMAAGFIEHWAVVQISNSIKAGNLRTAELCLDKDRKENQHFTWDYENSIYSYYQIYAVTDKGEKLLDGNSICLHTTQNTDNDKKITLMVGELDALAIVEDTLSL